MTGEELFGDWTLAISDNAGATQGTFNEWCLHFIYDDGPVAAVMGPLMVDVTSGGMGVNWHVDPAGLDGYNVYRRTEDSSRVRLNSQPLPIGDGRLNFVDSGEDLVQGDKVIYSCALVSKGQEIGFSEEVEVTFKAMTPQVLALFDNYPNPFNPITNIKFDLPKAGHVRLDVFDVSGRLVKTLVDENRAAASHTVTWDGTDNRGGKGRERSLLLSSADR